MNLVLLIIFAYLIGSISFAVLISKILNLADPRTYGSKNPGATNILRSGNKKAALLTLIGDCFKGWLVVKLVQIFGPYFHINHNAIALTIIAVFIGHSWPVFFSFIGGKGVATTLGILLAVNIWLGLITTIIWLIIACIFRYSSLAALIAGIFAPLYYYNLLHNNKSTTLLALSTISILLIFRHRINILKLLTKQENQINIK